MSISPERVEIAKIFKKHIEEAVAELSGGYEVDLQGQFKQTPIKILIEINSKDGIP
jgi:hypothetical protein